MTLVPTRRGRLAFPLLLAAAAVVAAVAAPGAAPDAAAAADLDQARRTAASWGATAQYVGERWSDRRVPGFFAGRTLETARETLEETLGQIAASRDRAPAEGRALSGALERLLQSVVRMEVAVARDDREAMDREVGRVRAEVGSLRGMAEGAGR